MEPYTRSMMACAYICNGPSGATLFFAPFVLFCGYLLPV